MRIRQLSKCEEKEWLENIIKGRAPVPGWLAEDQWNGFVPDWEMLAGINPEQGALTTANANFLPDAFKEHITYDWAEHFRQERAEKLIVGDEKVAEDFHKLHERGEIEKEFHIYVTDGYIEMAEGEYI